MRSALVGMVGLVIFGLGGWLPSPPSVLPVAPPTPKAVVGIPEPCAAKNPWPADASPERTKVLMQQAFGLALSGDDWTNPSYRPIVKIIWQTLDSVGCTSYLQQARQGSGQQIIKIQAGSTRSWAWGDWGLTNPGKLTFDFSKWVTALPDDPGRLVRITIHELGHMIQVNRFSNPPYWRAFQEVYSARGQFSSYGSGDLENMSEVVGYYVARCAKDNPYNQGNDAYYQWAKTYIFKGVEFGPGPGVTPSC